MVSAYYTNRQLDVTWMQPGALGVLVVSNSTHDDAAHWMLASLCPSEVTLYDSTLQQSHSRVKRGLCVTIIEHREQYAQVLVGGTFGWIEVDLVEQLK